ncbi:glycosyltransferase family 4 protein [Halorarius halobius]|uniref:glycosyltransferase family 4 protein n=1 Tax=Halorarius halobius TaxID=2962671 RepID=UPI0020CE459B|nr:glycosyltransferase family 4 protein [Halorarius halobius]
MSSERLRVAMVATPDDGSCGVGTYAGDLRAVLADEAVAVDHVELATNTRSPLHVARVAWRAGTADVDAVHLQHEYGLFGPMTYLWWAFAPVLFLLSRLRGVPVVVTLHEAWDRETTGETAAWLQYAYVRLVNWSLALLADRLVFLSDSRAEAFTGTVETSHATRLPHGVNLVDAEPTVDARDRLGYDPEDTLVVEPGYVSPQKGADTFLELAERFPDAEFLLAGGARTPGDEAFIGELESQAPENLQITGVLDDELFRGVFDAAGLAVLPYRKQGQSGILNWCIAYGLPVVAGDVDYFREVADEWDCVGLFDPDDIDDAAAAVDQYLTDPEAREQLAAGMEQFRTENSFAAVARRHADLYAALAGD